MHGDHGIYAIAQASFLSKIDGFRDIPNRNFGLVIIGDFHEKNLKTHNSIYEIAYFPMMSKLSSVLKCQLLLR